MSDERISESFNYPSHYLDLDGEKMHYIETGVGDPILFLHGIPTSNYIWRNVIPHLATLGRCIAPDLIGFGLSDKPDIEYSVSDHIRYIEAFIAKLNLKNITFVMHGFGSVIGFHYAMTHEKNCKGLVFYESFLRSLSDSDISLPYLEQLDSLRSDDGHFDMNIDGVAFIDKMIPQTIMRELSDQEMNHYRQPFAKAGTGKPILQYLNELPIGDGHSRIDQLIHDYSEKLTHSSLPKLMLYSVPGFITTIATAMWAKDHLPNLEMIDIGEELHLAQESCPQLMGESISVWLQSIEQMQV